MAGALVQSATFERPNDSATLAVFAKTSVLLFVLLKTHQLKISHAIQAVSGHTAEMPTTASRVNTYGATRVRPASTPSGSRSVLETSAIPVSSFSAAQSERSLTRAVSPLAVSLTLGQAVAQWNPSAAAGVRCCGEDGYAKLQVPDRLIRRGITS
jgi:hypothetical protein